MKDETGSTIFLTAMNSRDAIMKGYESGANFYIAQPFDPDRVRRNHQRFAERDNLTPRPKQFTAATLRREEITPDGTPIASPISSEPEPTLHLRSRGRGASPHRPWCRAASGRAAEPRPQRRDGHRRHKRHTEIVARGEDLGRESYEEGESAE